MVPSPLTRSWYRFPVRSSTTASVPGPPPTTGRRASCALVSCRRGPAHPPRPPTTSAFSPAPEHAGAVRRGARAPGRPHRRCPGCPPRPGAAGAATAGPPPAPPPWRPPPTRPLAPLPGPDGGARAVSLAEGGVRNKSVFFSLFSFRGSSRPGRARCLVRGWGQLRAGFLKIDPECCLEAWAGGGPGVGQGFGPGWLVWAERPEAGRGGGGPGQQPGVARGRPRGRGGAVVSAARRAVR